MTRRIPFLSMLRHGARFRLALCLTFASLGAVFFQEDASAYALNGKTWPNGSNIVFQLGLGAPPFALADGSSSWNEAVYPVFATWNQKIARIQLSGVMDATPPVASGDHVNSVVFSNSVFGQSFGSGTLAVTYYMMQGSNMTEADVLFNRAQTFDSYRGNLKFGGPGGFATGDIRRVFLHELGHAIGLNHSSGDNIMDPITSNREVLSTDDIAGAQAMYGVPAAPTPTPAPGNGRLANISTRMKVGTGSDVLIGGFIVQGSQPKNMILRAIGPSLAAGGVAGAMQNPTMELRDSTGALVSQNDDWQTGGQASQITATGVAPSNPLESAIVASLQPGSYTAIVRGVNNTQGIAMIEGYELDSSTTRLMNLSTRGRIGINEEVLIGGLIVQGSNGKKVLMRALGPSLAGSVSGAMADPVLEVYNSAGQLIASNDNWTTSAQRAELAVTLPPPNALESSIVTTLPAGNYTAIVHGVNNGTGVGLVEVYDLEP